MRQHYGAWNSESFDIWDIVHDLYTFFPLGRPTWTDTGVRGPNGRGVGHQLLDISRGF
jgi:hypothetical protein